MGKLKKSDIRNYFSVKVEGSETSNQDHGNTAKKDAANKQSSKKKSKDNTSVKEKEKGKGKGKEKDSKEEQVEKKKSIETIDLTETDDEKEEPAVLASLAKKKKQGGGIGDSTTRDTLAPSVPRKRSLSPTKQNLKKPKLSSPAPNANPSPMDVDQSMAIGPSSKNSHNPAPSAASSSSSKFRIPGLPTYSIFNHQPSASTSTSSSSKGKGKATEPSPMDLDENGTGSFEDDSADSTFNWKSGSTHSSATSGGGQKERLNLKTSSKTSTAGETGNGDGAAIKRDKKGKGKATSDDEWEEEEVEVVAGRGGAGGGGGAGEKIPGLLSKLVNVKSYGLGSLQDQRHRDARWEEIYERRMALNKKLDSKKHQKERSEMRKTQRSQLESSIDLTLDFLNARPDFADAISKPNSKRDGFVEDLKRTLKFNSTDHYLQQAEMAILWLLTAFPLELVAEVLLSALDPKTPEILKEAREDHPDLFNSISKLQAVNPRMGNSVLYVWPGTARPIDGKLPIPGSTLAKESKLSIEKGGKVLYVGIADGSVGSGIVDVIKKDGWKRIGKVIAEANEGTTARFGAARRVFSEHLNPQFRGRIKKHSNGTFAIHTSKNYRLRFGVFDGSLNKIEEAQKTRVNYVAGFNGKSVQPNRTPLPPDEIPRVGGFFDGYPSLFLHAAENYAIVTGGLARGSPAFDKISKELKVVYPNPSFTPTNVQIGVEDSHSIRDPAAQSAKGRVGGHVVMSKRWQTNRDGMLEIQKKGSLAGSRLGGEGKQNQVVFKLLNGFDTKFGWAGYGTDQKKPTLFASGLEERTERVLFATAKVSPYLVDFTKIPEYNLQVVNKSNVELVIRQEEPNRDFSKKPITEEEKAKRVQKHNDLMNRMHQETARNAKIQLYLLSTSSSTPSRYVFTIVLDTLNKGKRRWTLTSDELEGRTDLSKHGELFTTGGRQGLVSFAKKVVEKVNKHGLDVADYVDDAQDRFGSMFIDEEEEEESGSVDDE
ncbi:uncharacterized protein JCM6883_003476 [Sporobolomyces salmoneus]|uniref:uncharacterized protein n=1 Tax=Sporobolomyces salmoneus TaxID=183962 RepID=UPI00317FC394